MAVPAAPPEVMELKRIPVMTAASIPVVNSVSSLVESLNPAATSARAPPRVSPVSVIVIWALVPVSTPPVVSTIEVLVEVAEVDDATVKDGTVLVMDDTDPTK